LTIDGGKAKLRIPPAGQVDDQSLERFAVGELPGPGEGHDVPIAQLLDRGEVDARGLRGIGDDHDLLTPCRTSKRLEHLAKQGVFGLVARIAFAPDEREIHWDALDAPVSHENHDAEAKDVGMRLTETGFLCHRMLGAAFALESTVAHEVLVAPNSCEIPGHTA
jgi:hypothetical protein